MAQGTAPLDLRLPKATEGMVVSMREVHVGSESAAPRVAPPVGSPSGVEQAPPVGAVMYLPFSGPVVLDQSHHVTDTRREGVALTVAWLGADAAKWEERLLQGGTRTVVTTLRELLPRRLVSVLLELAVVGPDRKLAELSRDERRRLVRVLAACPLEVEGDEGYRTAEVTGGGIALDEVATKTLESRLVPGLFLAGEILDVTGRIGGFNFLWAWVSGRKVGLAVAAQVAVAAQ